VALRNVLVTAASRRVALVRSLQAALRRRGESGLVVAADICEWSPAVHHADVARRVPCSDAPDYVDALLDICQADDVGLLVPTIDDELGVLAAARARFETAGVEVAGPTVETARLCQDKALTAAHLSRHGLPVARTWTPDELDIDSAVLPLFIKPRQGRGSIGAYRVNTREDLRFFLGYVHDPIVQQYLDGPEYTIDMLCDFNGRPLSVVPRERLLIRAGVSDRGRTTADPRLIDLALRCAGIFEFRGAVNLQCRVVGEQPILFEINPRFSGGIQLTIAAGADFAEWLVGLGAGEQVAPRIGAFRAGVCMSSYETSLFFDREPSDVLVPRPEVEASVPGRHVS
jgi:carbamoyl-phosphate synthase large subunit